MFKEAKETVSRLLVDLPLFPFLFGQKRHGFDSCNELGCDWTRELSSKGESECFESCTL